MKVNRIMKLFQRSILVAAILLIQAFFAGASDEIICPEQILVQQTIEQAIPGWQAFGTHKSHHFRNISFYEGSPDKQYLLAPDSERKIKGKLIAQWPLPASEEGYWVSCEYTQTSATVAKKLPEGVNFCEVEYDENDTQPVVKKWRCGTRAGAKTKTDNSKKVLKKSAIGGK